MSKSPDMAFRKDLAFFCVKQGFNLAAVAVSCYLSYKYVFAPLLYPNQKKQEDAEKQLKVLTRALGIDPNMKLNEHEVRIATQLVIPETDGIDWNSVGGCDALLDRLEDHIIMPLRLLERKGRLSSATCSPTKGVLLYGPPGCGKTLMARAIAKKANARFINLDLSVVGDLWYGESQKLTRAIFTLARKIQPCIIFIDEIDSFLRKRNSFDHETTALVKTQFMSLWDGFNSSEDNVIVMGATNRPGDLDAAVLRRLPLRVHVPMPNEAARAEILKVLLHDADLVDGFDFGAVAKATHNLCGADLKEVCRIASLKRCKKAITNNLDIEEMNFTEDDLIESAREFIENSGSGFFGTSASMTTEGLD